MFEKVIGYEKVKKELERILSLYKDKEKFDDVDYPLPGGIILNGRFATGKSLLAKDLIKEFEALGYDIDEVGDEEDAGNYKQFLEKTYGDNKKEPKPQAPRLLYLPRSNFFLTSPKYEKILELIKLLHPRSFVIAEYDEGESDEKENILARYKSYDRLGAIFLLPTINMKQRADIIELKLKEAHLDTSLMDSAKIAIMINNFGFSAVDRIIKQYAEAYKGKESTEHFLEYAMLYAHNALELEYKKIDIQYPTAVHEAGHCIVYLQHDDEMMFVGAMMCQDDDSASGLTMRLERDLIGQTNTGDIYTNIDIALGGIAAEEVVFGAYQTGGGSDLSRVISSARNIYERCGVNGFNHLLGNVKREETSDRKKASIEKAINKIIKKRWKVVIRILKEHKEELLKLAKILHEKGTFVFTDLPKIGLPEPDPRRDFFGY